MHSRPITSENVRLFYRSRYEVKKGKVGGHYRGPLFIPPKSSDDKGLFRLLDPDNIIAQIRLYRWFWKEWERLKEFDNLSGIVLKDDLMRQCFADWPSVNKVRVGRLLRMVVQYDVNFQKNASKGIPTRMFWRWSHPLDFAYGLEHLIELWLPRVIVEDGGKCGTAEEFIEELEVLRDQDEEEDRELVSTILSNNLY